MAETMEWEVLEEQVEYFKSVKTYSVEIKGGILMGVNMWHNGKWIELQNNEIKEENKQIVEELGSGTPVNLIGLLGILDGLDVIDINVALEKIKEKSK